MTIRDEHMATASDAAATRLSLSVVMPVRDDGTHLRESVEAVLAQRFPEPFEVVLAVAPSDDDTEAVAQALADEHDRVRVVPNPKANTPAALNAAIAASTGDVVARVDARARLHDGYLARAVELLEATGADNVGGIQRAVGHTPFQVAVAAAMTSRFGVGDSKFHYGGEPGPTDTVYLGVFRRDTLERVGGFDETLVRNQDYELNWRIRESGGVVYFHPDLVADYRPRPTLRALARQYFQYGTWKRVVARRHPASLRWRHLVPPFTLLANLAGIVVATLWSPVALAVPGGYTAALFGASAITARTNLSTLVRLPAVFATMHMAWAAGFLFGRAPRAPQNR